MVPQQEIQSSKFQGVCLSCNSICSCVSKPKRDDPSFQSRWLFICLVKLDLRHLVSAWETSSWSKGKDKPGCRRIFRNNCMFDRVVICFCYSNLFYLLMYSLLDWSQWSLLCVNFFMVLLCIQSWEQILWALTLTLASQTGFCCTPQNQNSWNRRLMGCEQKVIHLNSGGATLRDQTLGTTDGPHLLCFNAELMAVYYGLMMFLPSTSPLCIASSWIYTRCCMYA